MQIVVAVQFAGSSFRYSARPVALTESHFTSIFHHFRWGILVSSSAIFGMSFDWPCARRSHLRDNPSEMVNSYLTLEIVDGSKVSLPSYYDAYHVFLSRSVISRRFVRVFQTLKLRGQEQHFDFASECLLRLSGSFRATFSPQGCLLQLPYLSSSSLLFVSRREAA